MATNNNNNKCHVIKKKKNQLTKFKEIKKKKSNDSILNFNTNPEKVNSN